LGFLFAANAGAGIPPTFSGPFFSQQTTFGFEQPIGMAVAPDGRMFVTDDKGIVWTSMGGGAKAKPVFDLGEHVNSLQDRGLVSVAVDKSYALNRRIYLSYVFENRTKAELQATPSLAELPKTERLVWVTVPSDMELAALAEPIKLAPEDEHMVLGGYSSDVGHPGVPFSTSHACPQPSDLVVGSWSTENETDCIPDDSVEHTIDSVRVDPVDGTLWVSIGDGSGGDASRDPDSWRSQRIESYSGKLLHVSTSGEGLPGHPFCPADEDLTDVCTKVYAKGFRNPFRFFLRPGPDGRPTVADAGWATREELDLAEEGKNYGWPCREGKIPTPTWSERSECVALSAQETFAEPVYDYPNLTGGAILGGISYSGMGGASDYPTEYKGAIFISDFVTNEVKYLRLNEAGTAVEPGYPKVFADNLMAVDWATAADGDLIYLDIGFGPSEQAQVREISFDSDNAPPEAVVAADKRFGPMVAGQFKVKFDAFKSTDPDGDPLTYEWDLDGDGDTDDSTSQKPEWAYDEEENVEVTLRVQDGHGHESVATVELYPGDEAPAPEFDSGPTTYTDGEPIDFTGSASDPEDGALPQSALSWNVKLNHGGTHIHPITQKSGAGSVGFTTVTDHDAPSTYIVELTATDSRGLSITTVRTLTPRTKLVRIESSPQGAPIAYGALGQTAPYEKQSTIGLELTLSAASTFTQGGSTYEFEAWSDGGERTHDLLVPGHDVSLTVKYRKLGEAAGDGAGSGGGLQGGSSRDTSPARLSFDPKRGLLRRGKAVLRGTASDPSGLRRVQVALRQARKEDGGCRWWMQSSGAFASGVRSCGRPAYMTAKLEGSGEKVSWVLPLSGQLQEGRYLLFFHSVDGAGNVGGGPAGSRPVSLRVG
jgi:glucose/arabinose dehydrogenase/PKD repeat protein